MKADVRRLRPLNAPAPVAVRVDDRGWPAAVKSGRRFLTVTDIREDWRIDDEWWREPISRHYFALALEDGSSRTVYRDLVGGGWFLQSPGA